MTITIALDQVEPASSAVVLQADAHKVDTLHTITKVTQHQVQAELVDISMDIEAQMGVLVLS